MIATKRCTKCSEIKSVDLFGADKRTSDSLKPSCRECDRLYQAASRQRNLPRNRNYKSRNKDCLLVYDRTYYIANRAGILARNQDYRVRHPEVHRRAQRKRRALLRNLPHQPLTPQQYEILHRQKYEIFGGNASGN